MHNLLEYGKARLDVLREQVGAFRQSPPAERWFSCLFWSFWISLVTFPMGYAIRDIMPLVCLATLATVIACQAVISGAFSVTRQAMQLGFVETLDAGFAAAHDDWVPRSIEIDADRCLVGEQCAARSSRSEQISIREDPAQFVMQGVLPRESDAARQLHALIDGGGCLCVDEGMGGGGQC